jgi:hypothetical protein
LTCLIHNLKEMFDDLGDLLCKITGFDSFSLQPNAGAAGEYAGLMVIRKYHLVLNLDYYLFGISCFIMVTNNFPFVVNCLFI